MTHKMCNGVETFNDGDEGPVQMWAYSQSHPAADGSRSFLDTADAKILDCNECVAIRTLIYFVTGSLI